MADVSWGAALLRYRTTHNLVTLARRRPFSVQAVGASLVVIPPSGQARPITERQWERSLPLIDGVGRGSLLQASFNSSYIEAILDDIRRA